MHRNPTTAAALALAFALAGCQSSAAQRIEWLTFPTTAEVREHCRLFGPGEHDGCAFFDPRAGRCVVVTTDPGANDDIAAAELRIRFPGERTLQAGSAADLVRVWAVYVLGHEVMHCFRGNWHK